MKRITHLIAVAVTAALLTLGGGAVAAFADASPSPTPTGPTETYTAALWDMPTNGDFGPQHLITSQADPSQSLSVFDAAMVCGHKYQVDIYIDGTITTSLLAGGILNAPNSPAEDLIAGGDGVAYKTVDKGACPPPPPVIVPVVCTASGTAWATEDVAPGITDAGLVFAGASVPAVDYYTAITGNLQGITAASVTYAAGSTGQPAQLVFEGHAASLVSGSNPTGFFTASTNLTAAQANGTVDVLALTTWTTTKIATGPGSLSQPLSFTAFAALIGANTLQAEGLHLLSNSTAGDTSLVTAVSTTCGERSFVTTPAPSPSPSDGTQLTTTTLPFTGPGPITGQLALAALALLLVGGAVPLIRRRVSRK